MLHDALVITAGIAAILILSDAVVRMSDRLMGHYGLSGGFVGLTVLAIGTSLLEIATHVVGSVKILGAPETYRSMSALLIGSNIGSDIVQQNLLLPAVALVAAVTLTPRRVVQGVGGLVAASALLWVLCLDDRLTRGEGAILVLLYAAYLLWLARAENRLGVSFKRRRLDGPRLVLLNAAIAVAFALIALLAGPVLDAATRLVAVLPVSGSFFGVTVLGIAAAVPELSTAVAALRRGEKEMAAGILIGSNVTNPMLAAGLGAMISTYHVPPVVTLFDLPMKIATGAVIFLGFWSKSRLSRPWAGALIVTYFAYLYARLAWFPVD
ncbi:MAG: hypothetical protein WD673_06795 [Alphaproteobacteria bacterium]